jgi:hypothetical protein
MRRLSVVSGPWSGRHRFCLPTTNYQRPTRLGTTLSEVLVSTLVMSIGVVALATLFPISVLRSIQASQLTNAAVLRYNAESQLRTVPEIINIGTEWQPGKQYQQWDAVVPPLATRQSLPAAVYFAIASGTSGTREPQWDFREGFNTKDDPVVPASVDLWKSVRLRNYIVDPLGFVLVDPADPSLFMFRSTQGAITGAREHFGNLNGTPFNQYLNRFPVFGLYKPNEDSDGIGGRDDINNELRAATVSVLPDSWTLQAESLDLSYTPGNMNVLLGGVDGAELGNSVIQTPDLTPDRIVIFDDTLRRSHTFAVANVTVDPAGALVSWTGSALPTGFVPAKARVESLERRYSYLLSVRTRGTSRRHIDVVVFFRRSYSIQDEQVYSCVFRKIDRGRDSMGNNGKPGDAGVDDNQNGIIDDVSELGFAGTNDIDQARTFCIVQYSSSASFKPFYKKGSYVCDINSLQWYRVIDVTEDVLPPFTIGNVTPTSFEVDPVGVDPSTGQPCDRFVRLTLDRPIVENSPLDASLEPIPSGGIVGGAVLMRGIVDIFPLPAVEITE